MLYELQLRDLKKWNMDSIPQNKYFYMVWAVFTDYAYFFVNCDLNIVNFYTKSKTVLE